MQHAVEAGDTHRTSKRERSRLKSSPSLQNYLPRLPDEFQAQLDRTGPARPENGIRSRLVRRVTAAAEKTGLACRRIVEAGVCRPVGIGEVRMVEDIEKLGAELGGEAFLDFRFLDHGHIPVFETQVAEVVTPRIADGSQRGRNQDRLAVRAYVTADSVECVQLAHVASNRVQTGGRRTLWVA